MNLIQINDLFPTEVEATEYFESYRWKDGVVCSRCGSDNIGNRNRDNRHHCKSCKRTFSVTNGTQLHRTRIPLKTWLIAFAIVSDAKKGLSAKQLERNLGVHYETAWGMYHKMRELMAMEKPKKLTSIVEMDETFVGGSPRKDVDPSEIPTEKREIYDAKIKEYKEAGVSFNRKKGNSARTRLYTSRGRGSQMKTPIVGIVQRNGDVVAEVMGHLSYANLKEMVKRHVDTSDSVLVTDSYSGYNKLSSVIEHIKYDHSQVYSYKGLNTNSIESFWAIVKRGITGQYHRVSLKYLPSYVAEFVFKYNNRNEDDMFETLVANAVSPLNR
jgi:transposase-like protein